MEGRSQPSGSSTNTPLPQGQSPGGLEGKGTTEEPKDVTSQANPTTVNRDSLETGVSEEEHGTTSIGSPSTISLSPPNLVPKSIREEVSYGNKKDSINLFDVFKPTNDASISESESMEQEDTDWLTGREELGDSESGSEK